MKKLTSLFPLLFLIPLLASCAEEKQVYIVYFGEHKGDKAFHEIEEHHHSYLQSVKESEEDARASLLYSYKHSINGFAAELTPDQASKLEKLAEVVSVFKSHPRKYEAHTTRSWEFVGLEEEETDSDVPRRKNDADDRFRVGRNFLKKAKHGDGIIVGVLDSGVWPESKSFNDKGMGPVPKSWKGICQTGVAFNSSHCNRKIIGARYYVKGYERYYGAFNATANKDFLSPRDPDGHGSHTASTAVGRRVLGASALGGFAKGSASGGAPLARLAIYKACWAKPNAEKVEGNICLEEDMLAAIDDAIADGVHVISISIGTTEPFPFTQDGIAMGALHAVKRNIVVAASAGNSGPKPGTLSNLAPWIITVGASTLDRAFVGGLVLGNGYTIKTDSITAFKMDKFAPLVYASNVVVPGIALNETSQCLPNSLKPELVSGKVVLCLRGAGSRIGKGMEVKRAGGAGMILGNIAANGNEVPSDSHFVPTAGVTPTVVDKILEYIKTDKNPKAFIKPGKTVYKYQAAPSMTGFSSRGPNVVDPNILKPDITAPGLYILAAWSGADSPSKMSVDQRVAGYNIYSGTSMSCPHVAGAIALLKAIHPKWSSAAIRSALMTTAWMTNDKKKPIQDTTGLPANPFALGSGHFRPTKAADPGLVYDASYRAYLLYGCSVNITNIDPTFKCPSKIPPGYNHNYPSIAVPNLKKTVTVKRTVTNVGTGNSTSTYLFSVKPPSGISVKAIPNILSFNRIGQKQRFKIVIKPLKNQVMNATEKGQYQFGWFSWTDKVHVVRSPIAVSLA
ncbi:Subtilisin-like protease SBT5.6 [Arabidopsis thaliana]|jgi:subtilisin family serine protease|uniref:Subtilisin-like protease SBT5.6 n=4 Tax=Arabidopsis TaxID=3701 RepID=SBT56_ARATH|nr:subtilase family protein [Arabidopsis thaliana]NP_199378.1 subtilase family protein [Arabidopsis thaliana]Q9FK76.1 RecName: Full=Subtilisin-like protease SBT5.6; AltName: Full=Subtilase subfamily 5 member 6; Short=AtSBT5.6; Flags: Precursor [Arabidopsis thaliana]KAG7605046.1 PA domain [Arabidopsis thaliana x Arabidopsis arenosa]KAG7612034.1 PA domain [Arabidopsis suecica]AAO64099.1 putative subtilisin [Arabidopsis thaliana]AED95280.1 subtilase family protein [Arabidopsis thaliana]ANM70243|eukprot:NP_001318744.1 subtilase family protein [Arabidopsis thaliana]